MPGRYDFTGNRNSPQADECPACGLFLRLTIVYLGEGDAGHFGVGFFTHLVDLLLQVRYPGADVLEPRSEDDLIQLEREGCLDEKPRFVAVSVEDIVLRLVDDPQLLLVAVAAVFEEVADLVQNVVKIVEKRLGESVCDLGQLVQMGIDAGAAFLDDFRGVGKPLIVRGVCPVAEFP